MFFSRNLCTCLFISALSFVLVLPGIIQSAEMIVKVGLLLGSPYVFWRASSLTGIDMDICRLLSRELKYHFEYYVLPFSALDPLVLKSLSLDLVAGGIHITEERKKVFTFSAPYLQSGLAIVLRKGIKWDGNVERVTFAVKKGATGEMIIHEWLKSGKKVRYEVLVSNQEILARLLLGQVDAAFFDYINALYLSKSYNLQVWPKLFYETQIGFVVLKTELLNRINDLISKKSSEIKNIVMRYVGSY